MAEEQGRVERDGGHKAKLVVPLLFSSLFAPLSPVAPMSIGPVKTTTESGRSPRARRSIRRQADRHSPNLNDESQLRAKTD